MLKKIILMLVICAILTINVFALRQVAGPLEIESCYKKESHVLYGLMTDEDKPQKISLTANSNIAPYLSFPSDFVLQPNMVNYVVVFSKEPINKSEEGKKIEGFLYATESRVDCKGCATISVELKKPITINVCKKTILQSFFDFFEDIFKKEKNTKGGE